ncbi:MAG: aminodeoxychorismate synthase component I [Methylococcales bacterium]|nr:MAG: aminodeoxychorismate synthase component I [Methylococcales bacterium]
MSSSKQRIASLPYFTDSSLLFSALVQRPWSVFLDSGYPYSTQGRYDIIAADPICTLVTHGDKTTISRDDVVVVSEQDPFTLVKEQLLPALMGFDELPFNGGAIGYFSYDLARRLENLPVIAEDAEQIAEMAVGIYQWALIVDHQQQQSVLVGQDCADSLWQSLIDQFSQLPTSKPQTAFTVQSDISSNMTQATYTQAFDRIKYYLKEGDCYQVNLTQRFEADCAGEPWSAYLKLREQNAAPFSCYLNLPEVQILSSSPERFLKLTQGEVETKPIKGTRPRKQNELEDQEQIASLENSAKDRAENLMIVDLLRNDIGKTCIKGSVKVPVIFEVESYATVHHLVSTVTGLLAEHQHALDLLKSCFPGGSITGAPKIRSMEIIEELEPHRRGVYCGAIGYIGFNGNMDTNIAIRTLVHANNTIRCWAGGGIVHDSVAEDEYQESFDKAAAMLALLRQLTVS